MGHGLPQEIVAARVRVAVCTARDPSTSAGCLEALARQCDPSRVIVVTSGVAPSHAAELKRRATAVLPGVTVLQEPRRGVSRARNRALAACADGDAVAYLDDDTVPASGWYAALAALWRRAEPELAAIGGPIKPRFRASRPAWLGDVSLASMSILDFGDAPCDLDPHIRALFGANVSFRCSALREAGGFDERLGVGTPVGIGEDDEAQRVLAARGGRILYHPAPAVWHMIDPFRVRRREVWRRRGSYGRFLGTTRARSARLAVRRCFASSAKLPACAARADGARFVEAVANVAENVGVLAGRLSPPRPGA